MNYFTGKGKNNNKKIVHKKSKSKYLTEINVRKILSDYKLPFCQSFLVKNQKDLNTHLKKIDFPLVMKIVSPDIIHKTDVGCVKLDIRNQNELIESYNNIIANAKNLYKDAEIHGVTISPYLTNCLEVIIGFLNDEIYGPVVMFGLGGIYVEALKDLSYRLAPVTEIDAYDMIEETKAFRILKGIRGEETKNIRSLVEIILKISKISIENSEFKELDFNPVLVSSKKASIVDARIVLK
jgi:acyl-CoA synthetase (NDP forming)